MFTLFQSKNEKGQGIVEYSLILVLVAVVVIVALTILGPRLSTVFNTIDNSIVAGGAGPADSSPAPTAIPPAAWHACASEGGFCSFTGPAMVRYGANGIYATLTVSNGIGCDNETFGDPVPGVVKSCQYFQ
jgi:Flp pilus assembly pilin Flp